MKKYNVRIQLNEDKLEKRFSECPFCRSKMETKVVGRIQEEPLIQALECSNCHVGYADRHPSSEALTDYYQNYFDAKRHTTIKKEILINHLWDFIKDIEIAETLNILDFGGGDGSVGYGIAQYCLKNHKASKINLYVVDPNVKMIDNPEPEIKIYNSKVLDDFSLNNQIDFVIASAVIEHLKDPRDIFIQLLDAMKTNGRFYARTPYMFPFKKLFFKLGIHLDMGYPGHLFDMGSNFWNSILKTVGKDKQYRMIQSRSSLVESTFDEAFFTSLLAHTLKFPSKFFKKNYHFVGGWEVYIVKTPAI